MSSNKEAIETNFMLTIPAAQKFGLRTSARLAFRPKLVPLI
jgi:hypothetical protein